MHWPSLIVLLVLAVLSGWILQRLDSGSAQPAPKIRHEPDYYMEQFSKLSMDVKGHLDSKLEAQFMVHYPDDDSTELVQPKLELYNGSTRPWIVVAERGWVSAKNEHILLYGPVEIWRYDDDGNRELELRTKDLRILADEDYAESDNPTTVRSPSSTTHAVGMQAWFRTNLVKLLKDVRGHHEVRKNG